MPNKSNITNPNKKCLQIGDIYSNLELGTITIGLSEFEIHYLYGFSVEPESPGSEILNVKIRFKNNAQSETIRMNIKAYDYIISIKETFLQSKEKHRREEHQRHAPENKKSKVVGGIQIQFWILYIILILGFVSRSFGSELSDVQNQSFPYTYIYDVNIDKCVTTDYYKHKFSANDLKNPKLVAAFPQRPNELTLVLQSGEMYIFTKDEESCKLYRKKFLDDIIKQNRLEDDRYKNSEIDKE